LPHEIKWQKAKRTIAIGTMRLKTPFFPAKNYFLLLRTPWLHFSLRFFSAPASIVPGPATLPFFLQDSLFPVYP
jgi:hypothetical protein